MTSLYEVLKRSKTAPQLAPDMFTALWAKSITAGKTIELSGQVPLSFKANGKPLLDYLISGNTVQSGTPTPENPIMPESTGERTGNLFDGNYLHSYIDIIEYTYKTISTSANSAVVPIIPNATYTIHKFDSSSRFIIGTTPNYPVNDDAVSVLHTDIKVQDATITTPSNAAYLIIYVSTSLEQASPRLMINLGSTLLPYEPYGYKIPISSASTTTPAYLGEVETTRKIKKLVLTGEESWVNAGGNAPYRLPINDIAISSSTTSIEWYCSHYQSVSTDDSWASYDYCISRTSTTAQSLQFRDVTKGDITAFKQYLQQQYAAGTPVTVWYVLATPETAVVNEPLMRIGNYADTLSMEQAGVQIPTNKGGTTLDVLTAVKPSNVSIKYRV